MSKRIEKLIRSVSDKAFAMDGPTDVTVTPVMREESAGFSFKAEAAVSADNGTHQRTIAGFGATIEAALKDLDATLSRVADWDLICKYLHHGSPSAFPINSAEYAEAWGHADGFGKCVAIEAQERGFFGDWSHFRDSTDEAIRALAKYLRAFERKGAKLSGMKREVRPEHCQF